MKLKVIAAEIFFAFLFFSCTSLQDVNIEQTEISGEFLEIQSKFAILDGAFASGNENKAASENLISLIENELSDPGLLKAAAARLYALEGCIDLRLGRKGEAKKSYENSVSESKGDVYSAVLYHRINPDTKLEKDSAIGNDKAVLVLEEALDFYAAKDYVSAAARFDEAFLSLADFYRAGYQSVRDECWNLRDASDEDFGNLLLLKKITVSQMLLITKDSSDFLYNLIGGKNLSEKDLYKTVSEAGLLEPASVQDAENLSSDSAAAHDPESVLSAGSIVNKFISARFLWNLYNENKSLDRKTKYSQRFSRIKMSSPVPDVPVSNPDFDAVLGCVENEFIHLDDGINFNGKKEISALEFSGCLKKIGN